MSKAGMVVIAFRKIQTLPERRDDAAFAKANKLMVRSLTLCPCMLRMASKVHSVPLPFNPMAKRICGSIRVM